MESWDWGRAGVMPVFDSLVTTHTQSQVFLDLVSIHYMPSGMIWMLIFKTGLCMTTVPLTLTTEVQCNWVTRPETSIFCSLFWEKQSQSELTCPRTVRRYMPWRWCR